MWKARILVVVLLGLHRYNPAKTTGGRGRMILVMWRENMDVPLVFGIYTHIDLAYKDIKETWEQNNHYQNLMYDTYEQFVDGQFRIHVLEPDKCYLEDELYG